MGWDGWMGSHPSDCLDYLSICGEAYSCHEGSILSCLILTQESCQQWLPSKTIGTKKKKSLPAHSSQDTAASTSCTPTTWYYIAMMHLFLCVCRQLFAKIQTASNISCFVSHIQIKKLWRISYASFLMQLECLCWVKSMICFWANIRDWKAQYMAGRGAEV